MYKAFIASAFAAAGVVSELPGPGEPFCFHGHSVQVSLPIFETQTWHIETERWHIHVETLTGPPITVSSPISASGDVFKESYQLQLTPILIQDARGNPMLQSVHFMALPNINVRNRMQGRLESIGEIRRALLSLCLSDEQIASIQTQLLAGKTVVVGGHEAGAMIQFDERTLRRMGIGYQPLPLSS